MAHPRRERLAQRSNRHGMSRDETAGILSYGPAADAADRSRPYQYREIVVVGNENDLDYPLSMRFWLGGNKIEQRPHI